MSDSRMRGLERRWKETGSVEDETAYLVERVRTGDISRRRLRVAVLVGYEPARAALGERAPVVLAVDPAALIERLRQNGSDSLARRALLGAFDRFADRSPEAVLELVTALRAWGECPCERHAADVGGVRPAAQAAVDGMKDAAGQRARDGDLDAASDLGRVAEAARAVGHLGDSIASPDPHLGWATDAIRFARNDDQALVRDLSRALVEWALGASVTPDMFSRVTRNIGRGQRS